jgi:hypothetical protein
MSITLSVGRMIVFVVAVLLIVSADRTVGQENDPDLPSFIKGIDKETYLRLRSEHVALLRGLPHGLPYDPRVRAINETQQQIGLARARTTSTAWTPIGPAPIPNGQTTNISTPVSGRVTCIAVHPTDPNTVYVGTAQGGVYRSLNGGTTWTPIFDNAISLAIGAIAIAPSNPTIVYVGTGEPNGSADSYAGVVYTGSRTQILPLFSLVQLTLPVVML